MKIATGFSIQADASAAILEAFEKMKAELGEKPHFLILHCSVQYDPVVISQTLNRLAPGIPIHGGTSCLGVMTQNGFHSDGDGHGLGLLGVYDPRGSYGTGCCKLGTDPKAAVKKAAKEALQNARRPGEAPAMVLFMSYTGVEEMVISGLEDVFGRNVAISGGSAADDSVKREWKQFANDAVFDDAIVVSVLFPSAKVAFAFHNGYDVTENSAVITRGENRTIHELDGRPAAMVYNEWSGGKLSDILDKGGSALWQTTFHPLGRIVGEIGGAPCFQLSLLDLVTPERGLTVFSDIAKGERVYYMQGSEEGLVARAKKVAQSARRESDAEEPKIIGAFMFFCAGCMMTIKGRMPEVVNNIRAGLGEKTPFLGAFTFGEQGRFYGGRNKHGNLMVSLLLFVE